MDNITALTGTTLLEIIPLLQRGVSVPARSAVLMMQQEKRNFHIFTVFPQVQGWLLVCFQEKKDIERVAILNSCCSLHLQLQNY